MRFAAPVCVFVFSVLAVSACGDDDPAKDTDEPDLGPLVSDPFDAEATAQALAQAICQTRATCQPVLTTYLPESPAECEATVGAVVGGTHAAMVPLIAAGRVGFSQSAFDACLAAHVAARADCVIGLEPGACDRYFEGRTPRGGACSSSYECMPTSWCRASKVGGCGVCRARAGVGADCASDVCEVGMECIPFGAGSVCIPGTAGLGAACGTIESGLCRGKLQCIGDASATCARPAASGEACDPSGIQPDCDIYVAETCGADKTCVPLTVVAPPETCGETALDHLCNSGSRCDTATAKCVSRPKTGEACSDSQPCQPDDYCAANNRCTPEAGLGSPCTSDLQCKDHLYCIDSQCSALRFDATCR
jgi:hypothetical protein